MIAELAARPLDPSHPILPLDAPHAFMVPSAVLGSWIVNILGVDPLQSLLLLGLMNIPLLLFGIWLFSKHFATHRDRAALWALLFTLFLWGYRSWGSSGFLHMNEIGRTMPYPSVFAMALALICLSLYRSYIKRPRNSLLIVVVLLSAGVTLSHPVATLFLGVGGLAVWVSSWEERAAWIGIATMLAGAIISAFIWPYYPYFDLYWNESGVFDPSNREMYELVLRRTFPLLLGLIVVALRIRTNHRDPIALMAVGLCAIYIGGYVFARWSLGRVVSPLAFVLHLAVADWTVAYEAELRSLLTPSDLRGHAARALIAITVLALLLNTAPGIVRGIPSFALPTPLRDDARLDPIDQRQRFLARWILSGDVVMSIPETAWPVPAYGGKILAPAHPQAFVDTKPYWAAASAFFDTSSSNARRQRILRQYHVRWILVDEYQQWTSSAVDELLGEEVEITDKRHGLVLIRVDL